MRLANKQNAVDLTGALLLIIAQFLRDSFTRCPRSKSGAQSEQLPANFASEFPYNIGELEHHFSKSKDPE
jgi:hypothetical protein